MADLFVPNGFDVPLELKTDHFRLEPVGPQHNERDYRSWMSSIEHIQNTPGFPHGKSKWPVAMSLEKNLVDLERHAEDFALWQAVSIWHDEVWPFGCIFYEPRTLS